MGIFGENLGGALFPAASRGPWHGGELDPVGSEEWLLAARQAVWGRKVWVGWEKKVWGGVGFVGGGFVGGCGVLSFDDVSGGCGGV